MKNLNVKRTLFVFSASLLFILSPILLQGAAKEVIVKDKIVLPEGRWGEDYHVVLKHEEFKKDVTWAIKDGGGKVPKKLALTGYGDLIGLLSTTDKEKGENFVFTVVAKHTENEKEPEERSYQLKLKINPVIPEEKPKLISVENMRMLIGYSVARASCSDLEGHAFADLYTYQPLTKWVKSLGGSRLNGFANLRLSSLPIQNSKTIGAIPEDYYSGFADYKINEISQVVEFHAGLEFLFLAIGKSPENGKPEYSANLVLSAGAVSPIANSDPSEIFQINDNFKSRYPEYANTQKTFVAFRDAKETRFLRQYYGGLRFKTYRDDGSQFPATLDILAGFQAPMLEGEKKRWVFRIDGFLPMKLSKNFPAYFFCSIVLNTKKGNLEQALIMPDAPDSTKVTDSNVLLIDVTGNNRVYSDKDYYRIGVGIDLGSLLLTKDKDKKK